MGNPLLSFAVIKNIYGTHRRDYIENFLPLLATTIKKKNYSEIITTPERISVLIRDFQEEHGLLITYFPMLSIIERARKRKMITNVGNSIFQPNTKVIEEYALDDKIKEKEIQISEFVTLFAEFCKEKYSFQISSNDAYQGLILFLKENELEILFASQDKSLLGDIQTAHADKVKYLVASFMKHLFNNDKTNYDLIMEVCVGQILANAILYRNDFEKFRGKLKGVRIYLDTKFILKAIGANSSFDKIYFKELILELNKQDAKLFIFQHTYEEIMNILRSCLKYIDNPLNDPTRENEVQKCFRQKGCDKSDVIAFISSIDAILEKYEVEKLETPDYNSTPDRNIDGQILREYIESEYGIVDSPMNLEYDVLGFDKVSERISKDVRSIESIYHLRDCQKPQSIREAKVYFVTTNRGLANASSKYQDEHYKGEFSIPVTITDVFLGTLVWMQSPTKWIQINEYKMMATSIALLKPSKNFYKKLKAVIDSMRDSGKISEDQYLIFSQDSYVLSELMENTIGDPNAITPESIESIVEKIRKEGRKESVEELRKKNEENKVLLEKNFELQVQQDRLKGVLHKSSNILAHIVVMCVFLISFGLQMLLLKYICDKTVLYVVLVLVDYLGLKKVGVNERLASIRNKLENLLSNACGCV